MTVVVPNEWVAAPPIDDTGPPNGSPSARTTWWPVPLGATATIPAQPTIFRRDDGLALIYPARLHAFVGESESCKTWCAYLAIVEIVTAGGHVLISDFEDNAATCTARLAALGITGPALELIHFLHPDEPLTERHGRLTNTLADYQEILATWPISLAIFDGVTEGMGLEGLNPLDNADVATWYRHVPRRATSQGVAAIVLDHVTKDPENRGRYAIGGVHKLNGLDGAAYTLAAATPFAPGHTGNIRVTVTKDRPGHVRARAVERKHAGTVNLTSTVDGLTVNYTFTAPDPSDRLPTYLMRKVADHLGLYDGATKNQLRALGNSESIDRAVSELVRRGHIEIQKSGQTHRHHLAIPYTGEPES